MRTVSEVRVISPSTIHTGFVDEDGELYTNERCNTDDIGERKIIAETEEPPALDWCGRCFPQEQPA